MWAFLYCARESALQVSQEVREDVKTQKGKVKLWQKKSKQQLSKTTNQP